MKYSITATIEFILWLIIAAIECILWLVIAAIMFIVGLIIAVIVFILLPIIAAIALILGLISAAIRIIQVVTEAFITTFSGPEKRSRGQRPAQNLPIIERGYFYENPNQIKGEPPLKFKRSERK